jgi:DNA repair exonuclease SbcCD ATPase subunit
VDNYAADGSYANKKALEEAENNLNAFEEKMTAFDEAYATFTETRELIEDLDSESKDLGVLITGDIPEKLEQLDDLEERYANITTQIENAEQVTNKANKALDKLYGKDRVNAIKAVNDALEDEIELLSSKVSTATTNLTTD